MPERKEKEIGSLFEKVLKENFPNQAKEIDMQIYEAQRVPIKLDLKRTTQRHIIFKMPRINDKERILQAAREKQRVSYIGVPIRLSAEFSKEPYRQEGTGKYSK